jgi:hypothetical protein
VVLFSKLFIGVQRVPLTAEGADHDASVFSGFHELHASIFIFEEVCWLAVCIIRIVSRSDLNSFDAERLHLVQSLFPGQMAEQNVKEA